MAGSHSVGCSSGGYASDVQAVGARLVGDWSPKADAFDVPDDADLIRLCQNETFDI